MNFMFLLDATTDTFCHETENIWILIGNIITIVKIVIPIILILFGMIDLGKAAFAGEEKEIKAAQQMLVKRIIYGVLVFFVITIVTSVLALVSSSGEQDANTKSGCFNCIKSPKKDCGLGEK